MISAMYTKTQIMHLQVSVKVHSSCVSAPQMRFHDFWRYINLYVCMYSVQGGSK